MCVCVCVRACVRACVCVCVCMFLSLCLRQVILPETFSNLVVPVVNCISSIDVATVL